MADVNSKKNVELSLSCNWNSNPESRFFLRRRKKNVKSTSNLMYYLSIQKKIFVKNEDNLKKNSLKEVDFIYFFFDYCDIFIGFH